MLLGVCRLRWIGLNRSSTLEIMRLGLLVAKRRQTSRDEMSIKLWVFPYRSVSEIPGIRLTRTE